MKVEYVYSKYTDPDNPVCGDTTIPRFSSKNVAEVVEEVTGIPKENWKVEVVNRYINDNTDWEPCYSCEHGYSSMIVHMAGGRK
jgi:hypothetical protein